MNLESVAFLFTLDPVVVTLALLVLVLLVQTALLTRRIGKLTKGSNGASLEESIGDLHTRVLTMEDHSKTTEVALNNLDERMSSAIRAVVVRRFDPFENAGGQQSFASALLNEHGDGVVISGIHARDSVRVYAKDVTGFASERELSPDEAQAIKDAKQALQ